MDRPLFLAVTLLGLVATALPAADHKEAPLISTDPSADIADLYAFRSPTDPSRTVLAMTVNPFSVPAEAASFTFSPFVTYSFHIDRTGDGLPNRSIHTVFGPPTGAGQELTTMVADKIVDGLVTPATLGVSPSDPIVNERGGIKVFAGPRDDPFFFDVVGFGRTLAGTGSFTGTDGFAGFNVSALVIELPTRLLSRSEGILGVWATTSRDRVEIHRTPRRRIGDGFGFESKLSQGGDKQIERMGNPAVSTVLIPAAAKNLYNVTTPAGDADNWAATIVASLAAIGDAFGVDPDVATLASVAVAGGDTLKYDPSTPTTAFPFGRNLADDVIDIELALILRNFDGTPLLPSGDGVDANDRPFLDAFPYLAKPHQP